MVYNILLTPKSKHTCVVELDSQTLKVYVSEPPVDGKANEALMAALKQYFHVPKSAIQIISGTASRRKRVSVDERMCR